MFTKSTKVSQNSHYSYRGSKVRWIKCEELQDKEIHAKIGIWLSVWLYPRMSAWTTKQAWASQVHHHSHLNYNVETKSQMSVTKIHPEKLTKMQEGFVD